MDHSSTTRKKKATAAAVAVAGCLTHRENLSGRTCSHPVTGEDRKKREKNRKERQIKRIIGEREREGDGQEREEKEERALRERVE